MAVAQYTTEITTAVRLLRKAREMLRSDLTVQRLDVLLTVAMNPDGVLQQTLQKHLDISGSGVNKHVNDLSVLTTKKQPGPGLVESVIDPMNRTYRTIRLTRKGAQLVNKMLEEVFKGKGSKA